MTKPSFTRPQRFARRSGRVSLKPTADGLCLQVAGELDLATVPRLDGLLGALERAPRSACVDLAAVRFADAAGLSPFFDSAERRLTDGLPPLTISAVSRAVQRVVDLLPDDRGAQAFAVAALT